MSEEEKPLPQPLKAPFGRKRDAEQDEHASLMADRIAAAMAEGRLEEFLKTEVPDNEHARALVSMMMGMTGMADMLPSGGVSASWPEKKSTEGSADPQAEPPLSSAEVPEEVLQAIRSADVQGLTGLLQKEFMKRAQGASPASVEEAARPSDGLPDKEKEILDRLIKIAADNSVTIDWIISRALRFYVEEYQKTGRL